MKQCHDRAQQFLAYGLKPLDALHVALAEAGKADYFCTCDDRLRR
ncbi:MAG: PIN domain-containing protein [Chloroflexi bacterium]|nr:MAG: PIN domain-containing protein [Chloroflexota bacterium]